MKNIFNKNKKFNILKNKLYKKFLLKKTDVDNEINNNFLLFNKFTLKNIGIIFILTNLSPLLISLIMFFIFPYNKSSFIFIEIMSIIIVSIGCYFILINIKDNIIKSGAISFYYFYFIPIIFSFFYLIINFFMNLQNNIFLNLLINIFSHLLSVFLLFFKSPIIFKIIKITIKKNFKNLFILVFVSFLILILIDLFFNFLEDILIDNDDVSINQNSILEYTNNWYNIIFLFFFTVILAPIIEELACRHSIIILCGNKFIGYIFSIFYFSGIHVSRNGDWNYFLSYFGSSIVLSTLFFFTRYNFTYNIFLHSFLNLIAFSRIIFKI